MEVEIIVEMERFKVPKALLSVLTVEKEEIKMAVMQIEYYSEALKMEGVSVLIPMHRARSDPADTDIPVLYLLHRDEWQTTNFGFEMTNVERILRNTNLIGPAQYQ